MTRMQRLAAALGLLALAAASQAQPLPAATAAASAAAPTPAPVPGRGGADAAPRLHVIEDDGARIEETRLRGAPTRIVVHSKLPGAAAYEIQVAPAGRDRSEARGGAGQRAWNLFSF